MTIHSLNNRQATPLVPLRFHNARTVKTKFEVDEPPAQAAPSRRFVGASLRGRQITAARMANTADLSNPAPLLSGQPRPFYVTNSNYNPADLNSPETIPDPTATAAPQLVQWTSENGLTTTGVMNPFGLTQNNPSMGFYGAQSTATK